MERTSGHRGIIQFNKRRMLVICQPLSKEWLETNMEQMRIKRIQNTTFIMKIVILIIHCQLMILGGMSRRLLQICSEDLYPVIVLYQIKIKIVTRWPASLILAFRVNHMSNFRRYNWKRISLAKTIWNSYRIWKIWNYECTHLVETSSIFIYGIKTLI